MPEISLYIHIPFCWQKCRYCDFVSFSGREQSMAQYTEALVTELRLVREKLPSVAKTIFIGGGTPTCLPDELLTQVLRAAQCWVTDKLLEYTVEANPGTVTADKLALLRQYGVNRLSMGVQSSHQQELTLLGRSHSFEDARESVRLARTAGFDNINLDLIYGLPGQTLAHWRQTLEQVLALSPEHLSLYQLKIEEDTVFGRWLEQGRIAEFDDEVAFAMYMTAHELLEEHGYYQYEISNYARPGCESLHNQAYWCTDDYYGAGLAAHSFLRPSRYFNPVAMSDYLTLLLQDRLPIQETEVLTQQQCMEETMFMGLRMNRGVDLKRFQMRYGQRADEIFAPAIDKCRRHGWLEIVDNHLRLTDQGCVLGNLVFVEFV